MNRIVQVEDLPVLRKRFENKTIVLGTGCFDIIHPGHIYFLEKASKQGDILIVGINSDRSIKVMKGQYRPIFNENQRSQLIAAFRCVDYVFVYDDVTAKDYILSLKPDVFAIGEESLDAYPDEQEAAKQIGARLYVIARMPFPSTSSVITKIQNAK
ncbi:MAG: adenylyltransferase/cytidyltransferase family protein [Microgenomates group bacterium]